MRTRIIWSELKLPTLPFMMLNQDGNISLDTANDEDDNKDIKVDSVRFVLYKMQINRKISTDNLYKISMLDGIESLQPVSQYQLIVGLPTSTFFDHQEIQRAIEDIFYANDDLAGMHLADVVERQFNATVAHSFLEIWSSLQENKDYWILYIYPNGEFEILADLNTKADFNAALLKMTQLLSKIDGLLLHSELY